MAPLFRAQIRFGDGRPELISVEGPAPNVLAMGVRYEWFFYLSLILLVHLK